jgi:hypothetical protein
VETRIAHFNDKPTCDAALKKAVEANVKVFLIGEAGLVNNNAEVLPSRPFIAFRGGMMDSLVFMQNGASSCFAV